MLTPSAMTATFIKATPNYFTKPFELALNEESGQWELKCRIGYLLRMSR